MPSSVDVDANDVVVVVVVFFVVVIDDEDDDTNLVDTVTVKPCDCCVKIVDVVIMDSIPGNNFIVAAYFILLQLYYE